MTDPAPDFPSNALERALVAATEDPADADAQVIFWDTFAASELIAPVEPTDDGGHAFLVLEYEGRPYVPVFSSAGQYEKTRPPSTQSHVAMTGEAFAASLTGDIPVVLNPAGDVGLWLEAEQVREMAAVAQGPQVVAPGTRMLIGVPEPAPEAVLTALRGVFTSEESVREAHHAQVLLEIEGERPHLVIGVIADPPVDDMVFSRMAAAVRAVTDDPVDFLEMDPADLDDIGTWMLDRAAPFYEAD